MMVMKVVGLVVRVMWRERAVAVADISGGNRLAIAICILQKERGRQS